MKFLRCRICGDTYLGVDAPTRCPFCGATGDHFVGPGEFSSEENRVQLTEVERADVEHSVELERSNARYYLAVAALPGDEALSSGYKRLARIEAEHCSVFSKLLGRPKPDDLDTPSETPASWCDAIAESVRREREASAFYDEVVGRATNPRILEVFKAVADVERDHIDLDGEADRIAGC